MRCYSCGFCADKWGWGHLEASGETSLIGYLPENHIGSVDVFVCPHCGAMHSNMRGNITSDDRKPSEIPLEDYYYCKSKGHGASFGVNYCKKCREGR